MSKYEVRMSPAFGGVSKIPKGKRRGGFQSGRPPVMGDIGFIGLGRMGTAMAANLAAAGRSVIAYVRRKYGEGSVAQIATFGTMAARAAIKDVGRVLDFPLERVTQLTNMIPKTLGITLDDALKESTDFKQAYESDPDVRELIDIARKLEGTNRNSGTHAAGVVIANGALTDYVPLQREVIFQSENGILGMGPAPESDRIDRWLINAGKQYVTLRSGGSYMHHADSFALIRGGHLDLCVLGAFQVAENGDIANWSTSDNESAPAVGGAMDLAAGARRIWVMMDHTTKTGESRLVRRCTYPLTAVGVVKRVYTNLAVLDIADDGFAVREMVPGMTLDELQKVTDAPLHMEKM